MPLTIKPASGSGSATLISVAGTTTNDTLTLPAKTGNIITSADSGTVTQAMLGTNVAGNGPAFSAAMSGTVSVSTSTWTKVTFNTKLFDTNTCFDAATNYRFTPTVAGYYNFIYQMAVANSASGVSQYAIYKNGSSSAITSQINSTSTPASSVSCVLYLNGSTDYVEAYVWQSTGSTQNMGGSGGIYFYFSGYMVRAA